MAEVVGSSPIGSTMIYNQSMALVDPKETIQSKEVQELVKFFNETLGFCPNSVLTMQRKPGLAEAFVNLNKAVMANEGRVTSALKRMIAWVSSNATGCRYCQAHAIRAAERYGAEQEKLNHIWDGFWIDFRSFLDLIFYEKSHFFGIDFRIDYFIDV